MSPIIPAWRLQGAAIQHITTLSANKIQTTSSLSQNGLSHCVSKCTSLSLSLSLSLYIAEETRIIKVYIYICKLGHKSLFPNLACISIVGLLTGNPSKMICVLPCSFFSGHQPSLSLFIYIYTDIIAGYPNMSGIGNTQILIIVPSCVLLKNVFDC